MKRFPWFIVIALLCVAVAGIAVVALQTHAAAVAVSPQSVGIGVQAVDWPWNVFSAGTWELIRNGSSVLGVISSALQIERWFRKR
jgi:hypothetical protein